MAKSSKKKLDLSMACERHRALSPFTLTTKHVMKLQATGRRFLFAYRQNGETYYDVAEAITDVLGQRRKLVRFSLSTVIKTRLHDNFYTRWYFEDDDYLYPMQTCKVGTFLESFLWTVNECEGQRSHVVIDDPDTMWLRKKPLKHLRSNEVTWEDVVPQSPILQSTVRRREPLLESA